jgi:RNA-binding protein 26
MVHRQEGPISSSGELPVIQDLTPHMQVDGDQSQNLRPPPRNGDVYLNAAGMDVDPDSMQQPRQPYHYQRPSNNDHSNHQQNGAFRGGRRGGRVFQAPGTFPIDAFPQAELPSASPMTQSSFTTSAPRPERRTDKTLVVEKIPEEHLSLGAVNDWFKRFGTVTNVAVDVPSAKALVSFSDHDEAHKAWKSEDAVFGNRFVKVFWHRPMGGHGTVGAKMLQASAPLVSRLAAQDGAVAASAAPDAAVVTTTTPVTESVAAKKQPRNSTASALAAKQQLLKQQIAEQKNLMAKLESADSPEEKKEILGRLRKLGEEMKGSTPTVSTTASSPARKAASPGVGRSEDQERIERERLDKELELHAATTALDGEEESTEDLKAKLAKLKAEVSSSNAP